MEEKDSFVSKMIHKHTKRCSTLLVIRKMQTKTTVRYHYTSIGIAKTKKLVINLMLVRTQRNLLAQTLLLGMEMIPPLWKVDWQFL